MIRNELRAKFTRYICEVIESARADYIRSLERYQARTVLMDEVPDYILVAYDPPPYSSNDEFNFEEDRLADAFSSLPLMRQRVLTLLFVEQMRPAEVAKLLHCSPSYVYQQKYLALEKLRHLLTDEGETNE